MTEKALWPTDTTGASSSQGRENLDPKNHLSLVLVAGPLKYIVLVIQKTMRVLLPDAYFFKVDSDTQIIFFTLVNEPSIHFETRRTNPDISLKGAFLFFLCHQHVISCLGITWSLLNSSCLKERASTRAFCVLGSLKNAEETLHPLVITIHLPITSLVSFEANEA